MSRQRSTLRPPPAVKLSLYLALTLLLSATPRAGAQDESQPRPPQAGAERSAAPGTAPAPAPGSAPGSPASPLSPEEQRFLTINQARITASYAAVGDAFYVCPTYDKAFDSSAHLRMDRWIEDNTDRQRVNVTGNIKKTVENRPPREEALVAARILPDLAPGAYGYVHAATVVQVISPDEMVLTAIEPIDIEEYQQQRESDERRIEQAQKQYEAQRRAQQERDRERERNRSNSGSSTTRYDDNDRNDLPPFDAAGARKALEDRYRQREAIAKKAAQWKSAKVRVIGFPTAGLAPGQKWRSPNKSPQLVIVGEDEPARSSSSRFSSSSSSSRNKTLLAISGERFDQPLTDAQFDRLLASANMTRSDFVTLARDQMREHGFEAAQPRIIAAIEKARTAKAKDQPQESPADAPKKDSDSQSGSKSDAKSDTKSDDMKDKSDWFKKKYGDKKKPAEGDKPEGGENSKSETRNSNETPNSKP